MPYTRQKKLGAIVLWLRTLENPDARRPIAQGRIGLQKGRQFKRGLQRHGLLMMDIRRRGTDQDIELSIFGYAALITILPEATSHNQQNFRPGQPGVEL